MNKKLNSEQQTRKSKNAECEKAVSLRHGLGYRFILLDDIITALTDLKYYIDTQNQDTLFHSSGKKIKELPGYKKANSLLSELLAYHIEGTNNPNEMLVVAVPAHNIIAEHSKRTISQTLNAFPEV